MQTQCVSDQPTFGAIQIKRILVPIDFSPASMKAFECARHIAARLGSTITLLHVVEPFGWPDFSDLPTAYRNAETFEAEKKLKKITSSIRAGARKPEIKVLAGVAAHEIIEAGKNNQIDLIVIATHGLTAWKHFCIGSTAERVARAASCPVLLVRENEHEFS